MKSAFYLTLVFLSAFLSGIILVERASFSNEWFAFSKATITPREVAQIPTQEQVITPVVSDKKSYKETALLEVLFTSQAPFFDWSSPWQDACEEAVLVMAEAFYQKTPLTPEMAGERIRDIIAYEEMNTEGYGSITILETAEIGRKFLNLDISIIENPKVEELKEILKNGDIVAAPMAGRLLNNPYFTPPGPPYHMLLVIGFDDEEGVFIVNDPGTRRGGKYRYPYEVFIKATRDWTGDNETILDGDARVMVIHKKAI